MIGDVLVVLFAIAIASSVWRSRRRRARAIELLRSVRAMLDGTIVYRRPSAQEGELVRRLDVANADVQELERLGFRRLGELCVEGPDGGLLSLYRILVDDSGKVLATIQLSARSALPDCALHLDSVTLADEFTTLRLRQGAHGGDVAWPPFFHRLNVEHTTPIAEIVAKHAAFAKPTEPDRISFTSLDQLIAELDRSHARKAAWRRAQPPDELLVTDLRALFPPALFARVDKRLLRELREVPPTATVRRG